MIPVEKPCRFHFTHSLIHIPRSLCCFHHSPCDIHCRLYHHICSRHCIIIRLRRRQSPHLTHGGPDPPCFPSTTIITFTSPFRHSHLASCPPRPGPVLSPYHRPEARLSFHQMSSSESLQSYPSWDSALPDARGSDIYLRAVPPLEQREHYLRQTVHPAVHSHYDMLHDAGRRFARTDAQFKRTADYDDEDNSQYGTKRLRVDSAPEAAKTPSFFQKLIHPQDQATKKIHPASRLPMPSRPAQIAVESVKNSLLNGDSVHFARVSHPAQQSTVSILSESTDSLPVSSRVIPADADAWDDSDAEIAAVFDRDMSTRNRSAHENVRRRYRLPRLSNALEKDVLSGIFSDWEREDAGDRNGWDGGENSHDAHTNFLPPGEPGFPVDIGVEQRLNHSARIPPASGPMQPAVKSRIGHLSSDFLCLDAIMAALPDDIAVWGISGYDRMRENGVYLQRRDKRQRSQICCCCGERTPVQHHRCPQIMCGICHSYEHLQNECPFHWKALRLTCRRCQSVGHLDAVCTETWRQYHATITSDSGLIVSPTRNKQFYCCNCAAPGHLFHECRNKRYNKYIVSSPNLFVKCYDTAAKLRVYRQQQQVESPLVNFSRMLSGTMSEEDWGLMSATDDPSTSFRKRIHSDSSPSASPKRRGPR
ncbi:uncharacterized protein LOC129587848 [Paramacrobiotus metropolitanus]|uniref:uncharacterized protein LOC129587848 n=1 Tax=Paramacrobiotus metropolitanus TaxID=2943436 RepID=UPI00244651E2|nr:uncharacterized protein LOC129587848 [Paramacrobiotus metropolitanus]